MSSWLIAFVGLIYLAIAAQEAWRGNWSMAVVFGGYSFSNVGLYLLAR